MMSPADKPRPTAASGPVTKGANILAIASGKGGVGKTWFSVTLAHGLSKMGQRVLLFDADLGLANVDIQLGLMPQRDLGGVIAGRLSLAQAKIRYDDGNFDIIAGRSGSGSLAPLPSTRLQSLGTELVHLSDTYDRVVMDLGAGLDRTVRMLAARAGKVIVVTTAEPTSLTDAYAFVKMLRLRDDSAEPFVALNMSETFNQARGAYEGFAKTCTTFLGFTPEYAGAVRRDSRAKDAIRRQKPLFERAPDSQAAGDVSRLAAFLAGDPAARAA